jgi:hypothetical protein
MNRVNLYAIGIFTGMLFFANKELNAQVEYPKVNIASPNAAALGKFVDIPVNYHTGIPQVNIPLYVLKDGSIELPISLSYHAGGIKVAEMASWVGTGWALNAGGVITRTVRGIPDEGVNVGGRHGYFSNYGLYNDYANSTIDAFRDHDQGVYTGQEDGEPDLFFFNFNGYSGKFYFNDDRTPVLVSGNEDLKIEYVWNNTPSGTLESTNIQGFSITTGDGTKYFFGKPASGNVEEGVSPIEMSFPTNRDVSNGTTVPLQRVYSSWYLYKIESADQLDVIKLFYDKESFSTFSWSFSPSTISDVNTINASNVKPYSLFRLYIDGVRLSKIVSSQGSILFSANEELRQDLANGNLEGTNADIESQNNEARALKEIIVSDNAHVIKKIRFNTSYFKQDFATATPLPAIAAGVVLGTDTKRLKLDSIAVVGEDTRILPPYKFTYYNDLLPRRLSFAIDHWGFYNGSRNTNVLPVLTKDNYSILNRDGADRDSSWPSMLNGALTKVTYPTGGSTVFEFEPNRAKVNATKYNLEYVASYWTGFDGSSAINWPNVVFTGNETYELKFSNSDCGGNSVIKNCLATYRIVDQQGNVVVMGGADAGENKYVIKNIPEGVYTIKMYRDNSVSTKGATLTISKFKKSDVVDPIVGGLRIKTIIRNAESEKQTLVERYSYMDADRSSGILYERPYYVSPIRNSLLALLGVMGNPTESDNTPNVYSSGCLNISPNSGAVPPVNANISAASILPMQQVQGNHIGYSVVSLNRDFNGSSTFRYYGASLFENNVDDVAYRNLSSSTYCDPKIPNYPAAPLAFSYQRGELQSEYHTDANGQPLKIVNYKYDYDSTKVFTPALIIKPMNVNGAGIISMTEYVLRGYWKKRTIRNETIIDKLSSNEVNTSDTLYYDSPYHRSVTKKVFRRSDGSLAVTTYKYALDFVPTEAKTISDGWDAYQNNCNTCNDIYFNRITTPGVTTGGKKIAWMNRRKCLLLARRSYVQYRRENFTDKSNTYERLHLAAKIMADTIFKPILEMQDRFMNPVIETSSWTDGKLGAATFSRFALQPNVSTVYLHSVNSAKLTTPLSSNFLASINSNTTLTMDTRYSKDYTFLSVDGRVVEESKVDQPKDVYLWGYKHKFPIAKISNSSYQIVKALVDQNILDNPIDDVQLRSEFRKLVVGLPNAQVTTYTYRPLVGMTSMTDAKGMTTYYEYDGFQRLRLVRDHKQNIVKTYCYGYAGQPISCEEASKTYRSAARSQTFTRNNCPSGQTGSSVTYTVPEGAYSASSQAAADALAAADIAANGQNYANAQGQCLATFSLGYSVPSGRSFLLELSNVYTGQYYYYFISSNSSNTITGLPQGTYWVSVNESSYQGRYTFYLGGKSLTGTRVGFPEMPSLPTSSSISCRTDQHKDNNILRHLS